MSPVVVLAFDGLDAPALDRVVATGRFPALSRLFAEGRSALLVHPAPHHAAAHWTSVATGCPPDRHGVCHPFTLRDDGLVMEPATAADVRGVPFWRRAWDAGRLAKVAGWPATLGTVLPAAAPAGSCLVADGFAFAETGVAVCWPLAPGAVVPASARAEVRASRVHPDDVDEEPVQQPARRLLASWASTHRLGLGWASRDGWDLIALRFEGLGEWASDPTDDDALRPWCGRLDAIVGDYLATGARLVLLTQTSAPLELDPRVDLRTVTGSGETAAETGAGRFVMTGLGVAILRRPQTVQATDVPAVVLAALGIETVGPTAPAASLPDRFARTRSADAAGLAWLHGHGVARADTGVLAARARRWQAASLAGWAAARAAAGRHAEAADALERALAVVADDDPARFGLRLLRAQSRLEAGDAPGADPVGDPVTDDFLAALTAFAMRDWPEAEVRLARLVEFAPRWVAVLASRWLARLRLEVDPAAAAPPSKENPAVPTAVNPGNAHGPQRLH